MREASELVVLLRSLLCCHTTEDHAAEDEEGGWHVETDKRWEGCPLGLLPSQMLAGSPL
jgi:hypothetical protein